MPHDDFAFERVRGLAKELPPSEQILWQGAPDPWLLASSALSIRWVGGYFALLAAWRGIALWLADGFAFGLGAAVWYLGMGFLACAILFGIAWVQARTTVYTITTARVVMRIGAALTVNLNLPFKWIAAADFSMARNGSGSIYLTLRGDSKLAYLVLWPHVRPWHMRDPQPSLRALKDVKSVAALLGAAAEEHVGTITSELDPAPMPVAAE